jgi:hypothetical protein
MADGGSRDLDFRSCFITRHSHGIHTTSGINVGYDIYSNNTYSRDVLLTLLLLSSLTHSFWKRIRATPRRLSFVLL